MASYARVAIARSSGGWTVSGNSSVLAVDATFPAVATGTATATYFGVGTASSGAGELIGKGLLTPPIVIAPGITPKVSAGSGMTDSSTDDLPNAAATDLLKAIFTNTAWANISAALGTAGSLYISLHTADPGAASDQTTSEVAYT